MMDRSAYEKLSIRDSARSLKKYGSTSQHVNRNENLIRHYVTNTDTLQGIALKYDVTIEQIRRVNRLWTSDSLFLKEFLLIPVNDSVASNAQTPLVSPTESNNKTVSVESFDEDNIDEFLGKIDASIASTKEVVKKSQTYSSFIENEELQNERRKPAVSRLKQTVNNNGNVNCYVDIKSTNSLQEHEKHQDELFKL